MLQYDGTSKCYIWDLNGNLRCTKPAASANECPPIGNPHSDSACPTSPLVSGEALYAWDEDDRLIDLKWYDTEYHHAQYFYDFNGNRYKKIVGNQTNQTTSYLYNGEDIVREIIDSNNFKEYIHNPGIDDPAFMLICSDSTCSSPYYYFADSLGSIRQIIDNSSPSIIENLYRYGSWGEISSPFSKSETVANPYAYTAREFAENNLYYYRARYYNYLAAKFLSKDPYYLKIGIKKGINNLYSYANNDAQNFRDPFGLQCSVEQACACLFHPGEFCRQTWIVSWQARCTEKDYEYCMWRGYACYWCCIYSGRTRLCSFCDCYLPEDRPNGYKLPAWYSPGRAYHVPPPISWRVCTEND